MAECRTGERIRFIREMLGMTRDEFSKAMGINYSRLNNIEKLLAKVNEDEFYQIGRFMPEVLLFIACEDNLDMQACRNSENNLSRLLAARVDANQIPATIALINKINRGH